MRIKQIFSVSISLLIILLISMFLSSCSIIKSIAGVNINPEQFHFAQRAKMIELKAKSAETLLQKLNAGQNLENSDFVVYLSSSIVKRLLEQYINSTGWLDESTNYVIKGTSVLLDNGSSDIKLMLDAFNKKYSVNVELELNCVLAFKTVKDKIYIVPEPYDISPVVKPGSIIADAFDDIIESLVKINLADIGKQFPNLEIPVSFSDKMDFDETNVKIQDKMNLSISSPKRSIVYDLKLKDILVFDSAVFISLNAVKTELK